MKIAGNPGLILPGGGARAAYQVGVLKAIAAVSETDALPFSAVAGISAGAINASSIAQSADDFGAGVEKLESVWANMKTEDVFTMDYGQLQGFMSTSEKPDSLLDNTPLKALLEHQFDPDALQRVLHAGHLKGFAVTASNFSTGEATTFFQTSDPRPAWHRRRRDSVQTKINHTHLAASSALPVLFPPQKIGDEYFVDGSLRMTAPLSPVINLGADRILVIGVRHEDDGMNDISDAKPGIGEIAGFTLDSMFSENLNADIERMQQINELHRMLPFWQRHRSGRRQIDVMVIRPSIDVRLIAAQHAVLLPRGIRLFLRTVGGWGREWRLPSYLLFEAKFAKALIDLGYRDGLKMRPALEAFLSGRS